MFDLGRLRLTPGEARRLELAVPLGEFSFGGQRYVPEPAEAPARLDVTRMTGGGYSLRLRFAAAPTGPCMRCLEPAAPVVEIDAREVDQPGGGDELSSPYVRARSSTWRRGRTTRSRSASRPAPVPRGLRRALPASAARTSTTAGPEHRHEAALDPRWAKLRELRFE